MIVECEIWTTY